MATIINVLTSQEQIIGLRQPSGVGARPRPMVAELCNQINFTSTGINKFMDPIATNNCQPISTNNLDSLESSIGMVESRRSNPHSSIDMTNLFGPSFKQNENNLSMTQHLMYLNNHQLHYFNQQPV